MCVTLGPACRACSLSGEGHGRVQGVPSLMGGQRTNTGPMPSFIWPELASPGPPARGHPLGFRTAPWPSAWQLHWPPPWG